MTMAGRALRMGLWTGLLLALLWVSWPAGAADSLNWNKEGNRVGADIKGWDLSRLLEELAAATDWQVYVEPEATHTVTTKFRDRALREALSLLLGDLSYALLPQTNGPAKLFVFKTSLHEATQLVRPPERPLRTKNAAPIPNELIVRLKKGAKIEDLARALGAKVVGRLDELNAYRLQFDSAEDAAAARKSLQGNDSVESVESNYAIFTEPPPEGLSFSSIPPLSLRPKAVGDANRLIIGLIDTAIHGQGTGVEPFLLPGISVAGDAQTQAGQITHGDSMAQTVLRSVAALVDGNEGTRVRILPVDVYGNNSGTTMFDVSMGVYKAINGGAMLISLSLGGEGDMPLLHDVIKSGYDQGVVFFAAAGNQPTTQPTYPAAYAEVMAVTAGDRAGQIAKYANRGDFVDLVAPGSGVVTFDGKSHLVSGTSVSTANAAGAAAGLADASNKKPSDVVASLRLLLAPKTKP